MNRSSIRSPTTRIGTPRKRATSWRARSADSEGSGITRGASGERRLAERRGRHRDEDQEQHQHFGVAEVVFEQSRGEERRCGGEAAGGEEPLVTRRRVEAAPQVAD